jgi:hypothetical protein
LESDRAKHDFLVHSFDKSLTSKSVNDIAICMNYAQYIQVSLGTLGAFNGLMLGMRKQYSFYAAFKKIRGTTPLFYKEGLISN